MRPRQISCLTPEAACRLLRDVASGQVARRYVPSTLRAVARWIVDDQKEQADIRAGMARMMLDAAARVGKKMR